MPSVQWLIRASIGKDSLTVAGVNTSSSANWLKNYSAEKGIGFTMVFDEQGALHRQYQVGLTWGSIPPAYIIIDQQGIIRYRTDDTFNQAETMRVFIRNLLKGVGE